LKIFDTHIVVVYSQVLNTLRTDSIDNIANCSKIS